MDIKRYEPQAPTYEAVQVTEDNLREVAKWCGGQIRKYDSDQYFLTTTDGDAVYTGDWMTRNVDLGTFKVVEQFLFPKVYREVITVRCQFCKEDKTFAGMSKRSDGQFSTMCLICEDKQLQEINARRKSLEEI